MQFRQIEFGSIVIFLSAVIQLVAGYGLGRCPKYPSMPKFNMTRVLGHWYEVERSFYLPEIVSGCTTLEFKSLNPQRTDSINSHGITKLEVAIKTVNRLTGNPNVNLGFATPESRKSSIMDFVFHTRFPEVIARLLPGSGKYQILYTDYDNFAILWSCSSLGSIGYSDQLWVFGRERDFPADMRFTIYNALERLSLDPERLVLSKNKNCPQILR